MSVHDQPPQNKIEYTSQADFARWIDQAGPQFIGLLGEWLAMDWLLEAGYLVERANPSDLVVGKPGIPGADPVEVKTARMSGEGTYEFTLFKDGHTDHRHSKFLILLCLTPDGCIFPYIIPTSATALMTKVTITSDPRVYGGRWSEFRREPGKLDL